LKQFIGLLLYPQLATKLPPTHIKLKQDGNVSILNMLETRRRRGHGSILVIYRNRTTVFSRTST